MATATLPKGEMTYEERLAKARKLEQDNRNILATPSPSAGEISPYQIGMMSKREHSQFMDNLVKKNAIEAQIKQLRLTDEELASREATRTTKEKSGRILQLQRQIEDLKAVGVGKAGKIRPSYQRTIEIAKAELNALSTNPIPAKAPEPKPEPAKPKEPTAKEPWQMTQKEYVTDLSETFEPVVFGTQVGSKVRWRGTGEKAIAKQKADILRGAPEAHRYKVRQALSQGKPVPAEVLKDYPELGKGAVKRPLLTEGIEGLSGVERAYWDGRNNKLTVYYNPDTDSDQIKTRVAKYLTDRQLQESVEKMSFLSTERGTFKAEKPKAEEVSSQFKILGRDASGEANVWKAQNGEIIERIGGGEKRGWYKTQVGSTEFVGKTAERALEMATEWRNKEPFKGKEGWEIPRKDWMTAHLAGHKVPWPSGVSGEPTGGIGQTADPHWVMVERAVKAGKPVPANVLEKYPDLQKLAKPEPKAETLEVKAKAMGLTESQLAQAKKEGVTTELGLRRIEKNTRREQAKPKEEPKPHKEIAILQTKSIKQSDRALAIDRSLLAKQVVSVNDPRWLKHPNRLDVRGVDTPSRARPSRGVYADKGQSRMSRKPHRNWKRIY